MRRMIRLELGDQGAQAIAVHTPPESEVVEDFVPCGYAMAHAEREASMWERVKARLAAHFDFAAGFALWLLMAIFIDTRLRRRREHIA